MLVCVKPDTMKQTETIVVHKNFSFLQCCINVLVIFKVLKVKKSQSLHRQKLLSPTENTGPETPCQYSRLLNLWLCVIYVTKSHIWIIYDWFAMQELIQHSLKSHDGQSTVLNEQPIYRLFCARSKFVCQHSSSCCQLNKSTVKPETTSGTTSVIYIRLSWV